jgi:RNA polymerase primary sigma factor
MVQTSIYVTKTIRESMIVGKYFTDISKNKVLTPEEEIELGSRIKKNDMEACNRLVCCNLKFVVSIAKQYQGKGLLLADLISEGNIGLMTAARKFDVTKGFKFISFAVWWIRQSILKAISEQSRTVKLPKNQIICMSRIVKFSARFEQVHERPPGHYEIAEAMELDAVQVVDYLNKTNRALSLDAQISNNTNLVLLDLLGTECAEVENFIAHNSSVRLFENALSILNSKERWVITRYLGLDMEYPMRLEEIAEGMKLTKERVRQIKDAAICKLRSRAGYLQGKLFG